MASSPIARDEYLPWDDPVFIENPYPWFDRLRKEKPIHLTTDDTYVISRYEDVTTFARLPVLKILHPGDYAFNDGFNLTVLGKEPPEHTRLRSETNKWLRPKLIENYIKAGIAALHSELDKYREGDVIDGHLRLGIIPTHAVICDLLQLPPDDPEPAILAMLDVMRSIKAIPTDKDAQLARKAFAYLRSRVLELVKWKRANPGTGLADWLLGLQDSGQMTEDEVLQNMSLFWASGAHNPSYLMGAGLEFFATHPDVYDEFRAEPGKRAAIMDEIIRLFPAELSFVRFPSEDVEILGTVVPQHAKVRFMINSANRDPEIFSNPHVLDINRASKRLPLSFGVGHHGCQGAALARMETSALFAALAERVSRIDMAGKSTFDATDRSRAYLTQSLRLTFVRN